MHQERIEKNRQQALKRRAQALEKQKQDAEAAAATAIAPAVSMPASDAITGTGSIGVGDGDLQAPRAAFEGSVGHDGGERAKTASSSLETVSDISAQPRTCGSIRLRLPGLNSMQAFVRTAKNAKMPGTDDATRLSTEEVSIATVLKSLKSKVQRRLGMIGPAQSSLSTTKCASSDFSARYCTVTVATRGGKSAGVRVILG